MAEITEAMLSRAPKAVRDRLADLERRYNALLDELQSVYGMAPPGNNTTLINRASVPDRPLGRGVRIHFETPGGTVEARLTTEGLLDVSSIHGSLDIQPTASNRIFVRPGRPW